MAEGDKLVNLDGLKAVYDKTNGDITDLKSAISPFIFNVLYDKVSATETYSVEVANSNAWLGFVSRYDGGIPVKSGIHYKFGFKVSVGSDNTETSGTFAPVFRVYGTSTNASVTVTPSSIAWGNVPSGVNDRYVFDAVFDSDQTVYIALFGSSHTVGKTWSLVAQNMFLFAADDTGNQSAIDYFIENFAPVYSIASEIPGLETRVSALENQTKNDTVVCWGDSLTRGAGGGGTSYPSVLSGLIDDGRTVWNYGIGGENAQTIAARMGAIPYVLWPCTLTRDQQPNDVTIKALNGMDVQPVRQIPTEFRLFTISGSQFYLAYDSGNNKYTLTSRYNEGTAINITEPTIITSYESLRDAIKKSIVCICIGTNGWGSDNVLDLTSIIETMIKHNGSDRYIVIGMPTHYQATSVQAQRDSDRVIGNVFGTHFVNLYEYMSSVYALNDAGITPTTQDTQDIENGLVPTSLRSDGTHLNGAGYTLMAQRVYKTGKTLGYWD